MGARSAAVNLTIDPCAGCRPLGALLALKGVKGAMTLVHGSQGCSTYMRLYLTRHFKEPFDVASSSLNENEAVYGGGANLLKGMRNVLDKYDPTLLGVVTTCLSETIGDDVAATLRHFVESKVAKGMEAPRARLIHVSTPSYSGTLTEGYGAGLKALVGDAISTIPDSSRGASEAIPADERSVALLMPLISPAEIRSIKGLLRDIGVPGVVIPDISETLDGGIEDIHPLLPKGGVKIADVQSVALTASSVIVLGEGLEANEAALLQPDIREAGMMLSVESNSELSLLSLPMGLRGTDAFIAALGALAGKIPAHVRSARARYLDALADCHRITYGKRVGIIGEPHIVTAVAGLLAEAGADLRVIASASKSPGLQAAIDAATALPGNLPPVDAHLGGVRDDELDDGPQVMTGTDHASFQAACEEAGVEIILGSSHASAVATSMNVPLVRVGFPVYDRFGGHRLDYVLYEGSLRLLDSFCNAIDESLCAGRVAQL